MVCTLHNVECRPLFLPSVRRILKKKLYFYISVDNERKVYYNSTTVLKRCYKEGKKLLKQRFLALLLAVLVMLSGCGKKDRDVERWSTDAAAGMTYARYNSTESYTVQLPQSGAIAVEVTTQAGTLHLEIAQPGQEPVYTGNLTESSSFTVNLQPGIYAVTVRGEDHAGGFRLNWPADAEKEDAA